MKILIFGSNGKTGKELVKQGLERGHQITAFARSPEYFTESEKLSVIVGNVLDKKSVEKAINKSYDVIFSTLGYTLRGSDICANGVKNIIEVMQEKKIKRFIGVSSIGVADEFKLFRGIVLPIFVAEAYQDLRAMESFISKTSVDWTIVRPAKLTDETAKNDYRVLVYLDKNSKMVNISRADLAGFMLNVAEKNLFIKQKPAIGY